MSIKLGIIMDPIERINTKKDSSLAMLLEAQNRGYELFYMEMEDLYLTNGRAYAAMKPLEVRDSASDWHSFGEAADYPLSDLDAILMRKDPPFDTEFIYATYMLELAEAENTLIVNNPGSLRDANEKMFASWFPELTPESLISRSADRIRSFYHRFEDIVIKPLDGMGGASIFRVKPGDGNVNVIIETLTEHGTQYALAQQYIPEIKQGDKRILIVNGEPVPYCLARIPIEGENRANLAVGGRGVVQPLSDDDWKIANTVAPVLKDKGLYFVGIDVIGNKLTEINVTSPTGIREIEKGTDINVCGMLMDTIEDLLAR